MLKNILLASALLLVGCSDKKDNKIVFQDQEAKFNYCMKHIDNDECSFYRPFILVSAKVLTNSNPCNSKILKNSDTCNNYIYSTSFKNDFHNNIKYCFDFRELPKCEFILNLVNDLKKYNDSFVN